MLSIFIASSRNDFQSREFHQCRCDYRRRLKPDVNDCSPPAGTAAIRQRSERHQRKMKSSEASRSARSSIRAIYFPRRNASSIQNSAEALPREEGVLTLAGLYEASIFIEDEPR